MPKPEAKERRDLYAEITNSVIAQLESGVTPWLQPWDAGNTSGRIMRPMNFEGKPYNGVNTLILFMAAQEAGYRSPLWLTFKKTAELGGHVKKGEEHSPVIFFKKLIKNEGTDDEKIIPMLQYYRVFNADQTEGLPSHYYAIADTPKLTPMERNAAAEAFFANTGADIRYGGNRAFYSQAKDYIQMPPREAFIDPESAYSTLGHETIHWTKHPKRLDRDFGKKKWGDPAYSAEEIVAELGAVYLAADLGLELTPREEHASYIDNWLRAMKADKTFIFKMAGEAQKASEYLHSLQPAIEHPSPALTDAPTAPLELPQLPSLPVVTIESLAPPLALIVDRPEKPVIGEWTAKVQKPRQVKKVVGQGDLF